MKTLKDKMETLRAEIDELRQRLAVCERQKAERQDRVYACARQLRIAGIQIRDERELARQALSRSEALFAKVFTHSPDMIGIQKVKGDTYVDVNPAFVNTLGYAREEVIGRSIFDLGIWVETRSRGDALVTLQRCGVADSFEHRLRTKSGRILTVVSSAVSLNIGGEPGRVTFTKDITALKRYEEQMARLDRLNLIGEMAGCIAHEIRNPLTTIRGFLQLMSEKDANKDNRGYYEMMIGELDRANIIISDYLGLARHGTSKRRPGYLNAVIRALYPMVLADANLRDLQVQLELGAPPRLHLDEKEIRQMILNLVRNGLDAMSPGGTLTISTGTEEESAVLSVSDEGSGLDPSIQARLGTPFLTTKEQGTGLGLPICHRIAARHNARIEADTGPEGTTFTVRFKVNGREGATPHKTT